MCLVTPELPETDEAAARTMLLPLFAGLTDEEQDAVVTALRQCL